MEDNAAGPSTTGFTSAKSLLLSSSSSPTTSTTPSASTSSTASTSTSDQAKGRAADAVTGGGGGDRAASIGEVRAVQGVGTGQAGAGAAGGAGGGMVRRPTLNSIMVNTCQKGNPIITHIRSVPWEYGDIVPDYQVGATTGVLYLSLRYHLLHPEYIHNRIEKMGQSYSLRIMMIHCDVDNHATAMKELTKVCIVNNFTMIVAWTAQEVGKYLETYKSFERKPPDMIKERVDEDHMSRLNNVLTTIKGVNRTDVVTLASNYGSLEKIVLAEPESLSLLPGLGEKKIKRMRETFTGSFLVKNKKKKVSGAEIAAKKGNVLN